MIQSAAEQKIQSDCIVCSLQQIQTSCVVCPTIAMSSKSMKKKNTASSGENKVSDQECIDEYFDGN